MDFSENAICAARKGYGVEAFCGRIFDVPFEDNTFDLITARSSIEHLDNPAEAMRKAFALCKPSGWLLIKTPNWNSTAARLFKEKWYHLDCPRHLYLFTPKTIRQLLDKCGFQNIQFYYEASSKGLLGSLQYVFYGNNYRPEVKNKLRRSCLVKAFVSPISRLLAWLKQSDTMIITGRKKPGKSR